MRGAERTFAAIADIWPEAPISTLLYNEDRVGHAFYSRAITTSFLQRYATQSNFRRFLPLLPYATDRLPATGAEVVISSSSAFAHGIRADKGALHICYCHSPFRYAWHEEERALSEAPRVARHVLKAWLRRQRQWDQRAARGVSHYIANSRITQRRIEQFYDRESVVLHPPVDVHTFAPGTAGDYFLYVGEVTDHKGVERAILAARSSGARLKVVGDGPLLERLRATHAPHVEFLGRASDAQLAELYQGARAVIVPNVEEFGIVAVEAQASGRPVLGVAAGGCTETVVDGRTGVLVEPNSTQALAEAIRSVDFDAFDPQAAVSNAQHFSREAFQRRFYDEVVRLVELSSPTAGPSDSWASRGLRFAS